MVRAARGWVLATIALAGCRSGAVGAGGSASPSGPGGGFVVAERAESGPITAIAAAGRYLWGAGPGGLRRWDLEDGSREAIGEPGPVATDAILADAEGGAWVSAGSTFGRWRETEDGFRFEGLPSPGRLTALVAKRPGPEAGAWGGGPGGLFHFDGRTWTSAPELHQIPVSSLTLDDDGSGVWVGTAARGIYRAVGGGPGAGKVRATAVATGAAVVLERVAGIGKTESGTWVVVGNAGGEARLYALTLAGVEGFRSAGGQVSALVDRRGGALLLASAGPGRDPRPHSLRPFAPGEPIPPGAIRFTPLVPERGGRWGAIPGEDSLPPGVTVAAATDGQLFCGTERLGVVRAARQRPQPLEGGNLVGAATGLSVACLAPGRCFLVTGGPRAWVTDGDRYDEVAVGEPRSAVVQALAADDRGGLFAIATDVQPPGLAVTRYTPAAGGSAESWSLLHRVPLDLPPKKAPVVTFAAVSPAGVLWVGLRARTVSPAGGDAEDEIGQGAVEIDLGNGQAVQHRPRRSSERPSPEALPLPADLTGVLFDGSATWFASLSGVARFQEGQLQSWGENDGLSSERVYAIGRAAGAVWAATSAGLARHEAQGWRPFESGGVAARGFVTDGGGRIWVASSKGLKLLLSDTGELAAAPTIVEGDFRDVTVDRFGRVWAMSSTSIAFVRAKSPVPSH